MRQTFISTLRRIAPWARRLLVVLGAVLLVVLLVMNAAAIVLRNRYQKRF